MWVGSGAGLKTDSSQRENTFYMRSDRKRSDDFFYTNMTDINRLACIVFGCGSIIMLIAFVGVQNQNKTTKDGFNQYNFVNRSLHHTFIAVT